MGITTPTNKTATTLTGLHLYHFSKSNCSMRVRITLEEKCVPWISHHLDLHKAENITPEYFDIHPKGLVPTLVHDGVVIIESTDIIYYLDDTYASPALRPKNKLDQKKMLSWMRLAADHHIHVKTYMFANQIGKSMAKNKSELDFYRQLQKNEELLEFHVENSLPEGLSKKRIAKATKKLNNCFSRIERKLEEQEWTAGDAFSLSDITWIPLYVTLHSAKFPFENYPNIIRWKEAIWKRPSFQKAVLEWT